MASFKGCKQFVVAIAASASVGQSMDSVAYPYAGNHHTGQARVYAKGADMVIKFGDSTVTANKTVTSQAMADLNVFVPTGALEVFDLEKGETHFSVQSADGVTTGTAYVTMGYGEGKNFK